ELTPALSTDAKPKSIGIGSVGECTWTGDWRFSTAALSPMIRAQQTLYVMGGKEDATMTYKPQFETAGNVRVSVYGVYYKSDLVNDVKYEVVHNGKTEEFHVDLSKLTESRWVTLGTFDFKGDKDNEYVKLICTGAEGNMRASTVMFETLNASKDAVESVCYVTPDVDLNAVAAEKLATLAPLNKFADMANHWASYDVEYMANEGLIAGKGEGVFDPEAQITRAEYLTILDRAMGYELITGETYPDVPADSWYATYIATAKAKGLIEGLPTDDGFKPEQPITREEMALFTYNAIIAIGRNDEWLKDLPDDYAKFTDTAEVSDWAKEAMQYFVHTGIIKGMTETTVAPKGNATRAQGAVILKRFMQFFVWAGPPSDEEWVLTFNDEFNGDSLDWSVWRSQANTPSSFISRWPENAIVKDGSLHLTIKKDDSINRGWTSGNVWVRPEVFRQSYGYWEARYKITPIPYANNSFWTHSGLVALPEVTDATLKFEQDINEGKYPNAVDITYHHYKNGHEKDHVRVESEYDLSKDYHTYAMKWTPEEMVFYFDGEEALRCPTLDHIPVYPLLSSAIMTNCGEMRNFDADGKAQIIDYVRIWQKPEDAKNPQFTMIGERVEGLGATDEYPVKT
ncbi:MAG: S-layer homology domain-containing protein, partial [Clostridia bacterium]|nr:S-layer homology domain-containing protein [Clostridia bacterium]